LILAAAPGFLLTAATEQFRYEKWPADTLVLPADEPNTFNGNVSGLYYTPQVPPETPLLWAVQNSPSRLYKLVWDGRIFQSSQTGGWQEGKTLRYPDGTGAPDAEGVTMAGDDSTAVYVSTERDGQGPNRFSVLRFDVLNEGTTLTATHERDLTGDLPPVPSRNLGLEAIAWVPDRYLVANHFRRAFDRAPSLPDSNNEGMALAPSTECVTGERSIVWSDDSAAEGHTLRRGSVPCAPILRKP
jgi:hypothetical protein